MSLCLFTLETASQDQTGSLGKGDQEFHRYGIFISAKDPIVHSTTSLEDFPLHFTTKRRREEEEGREEGREGRMKDGKNEGANK